MAFYRTEPPLRFTQRRSQPHPLAQHATLTPGTPAGELLTHTHTANCSHAQSHSDSYTATFTHADYTHLLPDAHMWAHTHAHVQANTLPLSTSVTDFQSWECPPFLLPSPPLRSSSALSLPISPNPQAILGGSPALWAQPGRRCCHFQGRRFSHIQGSPLKSRKGWGMGVQCQV